MAGLRWFKVAADLPRHKKSSALAHRLNDKRAWTYVVQMWAWFCEQAGEGVHSGPDAAFQIADGAGWEGDAVDFCRHMVAVGFLDVVPEGFRVHDWKDWAGAHVEYQKRDAARKRGNPVQPITVPPDIHRTSTRNPPEGAVECIYPLPSSSLGSASVGGAGENDAEARLARFRVELASRLVKTPEWFRLSSAENMPDTRSRLDAELLRLGVERAADVVAETARRDGRVRQWLRWYLGALGEAHRDPLPAPAPEAPLPAPEPAWLAAHPEAAAKWEAMVAQLRSVASSPKDLAQRMAGALPMLVASFEEAP